MLLSEIPASASYVAFCDQDDVWLPRKVETLFSAMQTEEAMFNGPVLVHADAFITDERLCILRRRFVSILGRESNFFGALVFSFVQGASMMINRSLLERIRDLPEEGPAYDRYIHLVAEIYGRRVFVDRPLMYYRQHGGNAIGAFKEKRRVPLRFLNEDDWSLFTGNEQVLSWFQGDLDATKKRMVRDYRRLFATRNPITRLMLLVRHLRPYPEQFVKRALKVWLP